MNRIAPSDLAVVAAVLEARPVVDYRRFASALALAVAAPSVLLLALVVLIDPYYLFGSPVIGRINEVRPRYEGQVLVAKPYQVRRMRPEAVALGSSRVEVAIDPEHRGFAGKRTFNFALPGSTSYEIMLAFLHAQAAAPLRQAIVGLDFFGFNSFFVRGRQQLEARFAGDQIDAFADFLAAELPLRRRSGPVPPPALPVPPQWDEVLYLSLNPDVATAIAQQKFASGRDHYDKIGRREGRQGGAIPEGWDEASYLQVHPDVLNAVTTGAFRSGYHHYLAAGRAEGRLGGFIPAGWNERAYLGRNPSARVRIALGDVDNGYQHYAAMGRDQGLLGGTPSPGVLHLALERWPGLNKLLFQARDAARLVVSATALRDSANTLMHQSEPATFDGRGVRVWHGQDAVLRSLGGTGRIMRAIITGFQWHLWLMPPRFAYCFTREETGATTFDPYRFMLRRAYAEDTDVRLFITPLHAGVRDLLDKLGLGSRYEFWLRELTRINEEEAKRAAKVPFPLWDFSDANTITTEPIPASDDARPMRWYWEISHYRMATGDLILDRIFDYADAARPLPPDFGVRLTGATVEAHLAHARQAHQAWALREADFTSQITRAVSAPNAQNRQAAATCW